MRRALVSQTRAPEIDRDSGSQQVDQYIRWLREAGWSVTFLASAGDSQERYARRLRQLGVPVFVGEREARELLAAESFDLAVLAFWEPASTILPLIRAGSPEARVIVDSVDVHFLREARRMFGAAARLDDAFGSRVAGELNTYVEADAVITPSPTEAELLANFLGGLPIYDLPLAKPVARSSLDFGERRGMLFAGNFRHLPNGEAVEYLCREVIPLVDPELLAEDPLKVVGSRLDDKVRAHARGVPAVEMVGWVPALEPYLERARVCVAPLLHGAGIKGKIVESLLAGTPVVTTPIGAEGLGLADGETAIVADTAEAFAAGIERLLGDPEEWRRLAEAGHRLARDRHDPDRVGRRFGEIVDEVLARPVARRETAAALRRAGRREQAYRTMVGSVTETLAAITDPGATVLVVSRGDDGLTAIEGRDGRHFPPAPDGAWAGHHPADGGEAVRELEAERERGARYLALPASSFWWLDHYPELTEHLESHYRRVHSSDHLVLFDVGEASEVAVTAPARTSGRVVVEELPAVADPAAEWTVAVRPGVTLPPGFIDDFLNTASALVGLGVERFQPALLGGPGAGPPVTERLRGVLARELEAVTPVPVLAVRGGAPSDGPVALIDACPIELSAPLAEEDDPLAYSDVSDVFVAGHGGARRAVRRGQGAGAPLISVLISTYARPQLLRECLEGFCEQTLPLTDFEVVVVDDGSPRGETGAVLREFAGRLPLTRVRIDHAGRSAAKNLAVMLARGEIVLFFDDDDAPAPDMLVELVGAHARHPGEATAILGHTGWADDLEVSPLMRFVTEVDRLLFAYGNLEPGERGDWRLFWEGRVSSKRSLHLRHGLHDQRLDYSIDVEMAWRLAPRGLEVVYEPAARSFMRRAVDFDAFCRRCEAKGRAQAAILTLHDDSELAAYAQADGVEDRWRVAEDGLGELVERVARLEADADDAKTDELHRAYREAFRGYTAKGMAEAMRPKAAPAPVRRSNGHRGEPSLTVTMPVWNRTRELAEMAAATIDRVWEVARLPTEVVVIDNGSPVTVPLTARVHRLDDNRGVASGWNAGIALARGPVICVLNSDCMVTDGWDEALFEAATTGRRIAFPYTDHCDGKGFRRPDQAGTAGWCFALHRDVFEEIGPFDERFNPAYCEDTDYWHRAWELGIELSPVPAARVVHARRTSADPGADLLLTAHRHLYGWKHGVEPLRAPPYYNREIVEYEARQGSERLASTT